MSAAPTPEEMLASLKRSGYLLESRIVETLDSMGMFLESNVSHLDKKTGVSREIDVVAEVFRFSKERPNVCAKTTFVIEAVNNPLPAIVMTPHTPSPMLDESDFIPFCITPAEKEDRSHPFAGEVSLTEVKGKSRDRIFCQFCAFTRKKQDGELMASHPEDLYSSIKKAVEHALTLRAEAADWMESRDDTYWRIFQWRPVIVFGGELYSLQGDAVAAIRRAHLKFSLHWEGVPKSVVVDFVTEAELPNFVSKVDREDEEVEEMLHSIRTGYE